MSQTFKRCYTYFFFFFFYRQTSIFFAYLTSLPLLFRVISSLPIPPLITLLTCPSPFIAILRTRLCALCTHSTTCSRHCSQVARAEFQIRRCAYRLLARKRDPITCPRNSRVESSSPSPPPPPPPRVLFFATVPNCLEFGGEKLVDPGRERGKGGERKESRE